MNAPSHSEGLGITSDHFSPSGTSACADSLTPGGTLDCGSAPDPAVFL